MTIKRRRFIRKCVFGLAVALALVSLAAWYVYPYSSFETQFRLSKSALDQCAASVMQSGTPQLSAVPPRVGYFDVNQPEPLPHGFLFESRFGNPFDWTGLAYSDSPLPHFEKSPNGEVVQVFTPIEGKWYTVFRP